MMDDDKTQVIMALTIIACVSMWCFGADSLTVVSNVVSGLLGVAVGRKT